MVDTITTVDKVVVMNVTRAFGKNKSDIHLLNDVGLQRIQIYLVFIIETVHFAFCTGTGYCNTYSHSLTSISLIWDQYILIGSKTNHVPR